MKHIITIQHTESTHHRDKMVGSWTDWHLTETGFADAERIGERLSAELSGECGGQWKLYSSDLNRARETVEPLARRMGLKIIMMPALREQNLGVAVGKTREWAKANSLPVSSFDDPQYEGAETWREMWRRTESVMNEILASPDENIILSSHGITLSIWQRVWEGCEISPFEYLGMPGGVSFYTVSDDGRRSTVRVNDVKYKSIQ